MGKSKGKKKFVKMAEGVEPVTPPQAAGAAAGEAEGAAAGEAEGAVGGAPAVQTSRQQGKQIQPATPPGEVGPSAAPQPAVQMGQGDGGIAAGRGRGEGRGRGRGRGESPAGGRGQGPPEFQHQRGPGGDPQQYQGPRGPPQQQQGPRGPPQQYQGPGAPPQQQQGPRGPPQQQQGPRGPPQQQQGPGGPPQQQQGPRGPPQQQQGPGGPPQQQGQQRPPQQQGQQRAPQQQGQSPSGTPLQTPRSSVSSEQASPASSSPLTVAPRDSPSMISINKGLRDMSVVERPGNKSFLGLTIPPRKTPTSCGTAGRHTMVDTNHLALDLSKLVKVIYHYNVSIDPDRPKRLLTLVVADFKRTHFPRHASPFDGRSNLYSASPLPFGTSVCGTVTVRDAERNRDKDFCVAVKLVNQIDMSLLTSHMAGRASIAQTQTAMQALDIVLRSAPATRMTPLGKSFFTKPEGRVLDLGDGMECWLGFFQSAIIGWKPFVNIDVVHKGFPKEQDCVSTIYDLFGNVDMKNGLNAYQIEDFTKYIRELKVSYEIPGQPNTKRTYRVNGLGKSAAMHRFTLDDNKTSITVQQYYQQHKHYILKYPNMPCLNVGSPNREKPILIPCELCKMVGGQVVVKKMTEKQTSALIKVATTGTDDRRRKIMDAIQRVDFKNDPCLKDFGLRVNDQFECVPARILAPPQLKYKEDAPVIPERGVWRNKQFCDGKGLQRWTILGMAKWIKEPDLRNFVMQLRKQAGTMGMVIDAPQESVFTIILPHEKVKLEEFLQRRKDMQLIFVVVQDTGDSYAKVKQAAELSVGVLTQCMKNKTLTRMNPATCGNILLKVNAKLNGVNHEFSAGFKPNCLKRPCMIVGADVTHPSPDQKNVPSVAAVCASHEPKAFKYNLQFRLQPARMEIIEDLENIIEIQLRYFYTANKGYKPEKIIFYRDGVSEGQFNEVLNKEFMAIRRACQRIEAGYQPKITFLVVQKRHHTRFFPTRREDSDGRNNNVPAGTIVDQIITHPTDLDFYLVSHASIQGVSRPTKYRRLWDDSDMSEDELEQLTYYLCHMFTRCTRSVSYPAPTYYAHLAASRARCYLDGKNIRMNDLKREQSERTIKAEIINGSPMFFV